MSVETSRAQANRAEVVAAGSRLGVYLHVPFCSTICDFCAFYQVQSDRRGIESYLDGVERELDLLPEEARRADTFFWGGGTPSLLPAKGLQRLGRALTGRFGAPLEEWTVEMAPSSVKQDKLAALREMGVTRVSLGAQSFDPGLLEALGRQHAPKQIFAAYEQIREAGFRSVNVDLMFALPGQSEEALFSDLRQAVALRPDHLSTYCLTFEEDTALYVKLSQGRVRRDDERDRQLYLATWRYLAEQGYNQYEVSNYARPGHRCRHNLNTWRMNEWIGLGPSAASQYRGARSANAPDLDNWLGDLKRGVRGSSEVACLDAGSLLEDAAIFGLRLNEGIDLSQLERRFGALAPPASRSFLERLVAEGKAARSGSRIALTDEGRLLVDAVGAELLGGA